ncbi:MAG: FGGY-family carbohydrate kinase [Shimia sp.]
MTEAYSLGIDLGTSGVRSAVIDAAGNVLAQARGSYGTTNDARRAPEAWWQAARDCIIAQVAALHTGGGDPLAIKRLAVAGTSGSLVLADGDLRPVTRALMYDDGGFDREARQIAVHAPDPHVARGSNSALARALALVADADGRARHLLHQADFVAARLMGQGGHTDANNALKTGLDPASGTWPDWIEAAGLPGMLLPMAHLPGAAIARIDAAQAQTLGLSPNLMIHAGTTDSIAAFLAAAEAKVGEAVTSIGTTLALKVMSSVRVDVPQMGLYAHRLGDGWLVGGASNTGGGVLRALFRDEDLASLSARIDPDIESPLDYYPLTRPGERFPINDPSLPPRLTPRPADDAAFLYGILESIARIERQGYQAIAQHGAPMPRRIITSGGGARNETWRRIRARVLGIPVTAAATPEAAIGAARLAQSG